MDEFLTVNEIAELLKLNPQTVRNWIDERSLAAVRVGPRRVRVRRSDLDEFLASGRTTAGHRHERQTPSDAGAAPAEPDRGEQTSAGVEATPSDARDRFLASLTEIVRSALEESSRDRASALRDLAAAAQALADRLEDQQPDDDRR